MRFKDLLSHMVLGEKRLAFCNINMKNAAEAGLFEIIAGNCPRDRGLQKVMLL